MQSCIFSISLAWSFWNNKMLICCSRNISLYYQCVKVFFAIYFFMLIVTSNFFYLTPNIWIVSHFPQKYLAAQLYSTLMMPIMISWAANQHITIRLMWHSRLEYWCWKCRCEMTKINHIFKYIKIEHIYINCNNISLKYCFFYIRDFKKYKCFQTCLTDTV